MLGKTLLQYTTYGPEREKFDKNIMIAKSKTLKRYSDHELLLWRDTCFDNHPSRTQTSLHFCMGRLRETKNTSVKKSSPQHVSHTPNFLGEGKFCMIPNEKNKNPLVSPASKTGDRFLE